MFGKVKPRAVIDPEILNMFDFFEVDTSHPAELLANNGFKKSDIGMFVIKFTVVRTSSGYPHIDGWFSHYQPQAINVVCGSPNDSVYRANESDSFERV